jgi:hypothetical protein
VQINWLQIFNRCTLRWSFSHCTCTNRTKIADIIMHIFRMLQFDWPFQLAVQHIAILFRTPFKNTVNVIQIPYEFDDMKTSIAKMTQEGLYIIDDTCSSDVNDNMRLSMPMLTHEVQYINYDTWLTVEQ